MSDMDARMALSVLRRGGAQCLSGADRRALVDAVLVGCSVEDAGYVVRTATQRLHAMGHALYVVEAIVQGAIEQKVQVRPAGDAADPGWRILATTHEAKDVSAPWAEGSK